MEQWLFAAAAFGISAFSIGAYVWVLRARTKAAESALEKPQIRQR